MMISAKFRANFDALLNELSALGYRHEYGVLNASDCGVAQSRRRVFVISKLNEPAPKLPAPIPLTKRLKDYLEPEPVDKSYYLSEERLKGLIWSNEKEKSAGNGYRFDPIERERESTHNNGPRRFSQNGQLPKVMIVTRDSAIYGRRGEICATIGISRTITAHFAKNKDEGLIIYE